MAAIPLRDVGKAIFVSRPRQGGVYLKRMSFPKGVTPAHLEGFTERFSATARECRGVMSGLQGNEKVIAFNACIGQRLKRG